ncbi:MAG: hypothetical protein R3D88_05575 [Alphaproteobacteria bacterium]|nr:hypothetical protein [Alphaproteobacteria bacterium]
MSFNHNLPRHLFSDSEKIGVYDHIHNKTITRIQSSLDAIYARYQICPSSNLGILLKNGLFKLILGMHHLHGALNVLNEKLPEDQRLSSKASIKRLFHEDFIRACRCPNLHSTQTKERVLLIELGRTKVVFNLLNKIREYNNQDLQASYKILGSLIRNALDIYRELGQAEFNFSKNPPSYIKRVSQELRKTRISAHLV